MATIKRSALVPYSVHDMYSLVNDVSSYPQYVEGCVAVDIIEHTQEKMQATLKLKKAGLQLSFTTCNQLIVDQSIDMQLQDGPFEHFSGIWQFKALNDSACKLSLDLEFEFKSRTFGRLATPMFSEVANNLVDAFCQRAEYIYKRESND